MRYKKVHILKFNEKIFIKIRNALERFLNGGSQYRCHLIH